MPIKEKTIRFYVCSRCNHEWLPNNIKNFKIDETNKPVVCPNSKCHSPYWDKERRIKIALEEKK